MRIQKNFLINWLIIFGMVSSAQYVYADANSPVITTLDGSKNQIAKDSFVVSRDSLFFSAAFKNYLIKPYPVQDIITLHLNEYSRMMLPPMFTAIVHLKIIYINENRITDSLSDLRLSLNYRSDSVYTARASFVFSGAYNVKVVVVSDSIVSNTRTKTKGVDPITSLVLPSLMVDNEIIPNYVFNYDCKGFDIDHLNLLKLTDDELTVNWRNTVGADQYDLEWAYIDSNALASGLYNTGDNLDPDLIFQNNATRVSITDLQYKIPLLFPGSGSLFVRARTVHFSNGTRLVSQWSSDYRKGLLQYDYKGHETNLNWQSSISYAEDGKRKAVVQYYDGTLRNRQTVTKDNTTNKTVVAETFYDYQGRAAIQVLPSPSIDKIIEYTANFNRVNGAEYDKSYFDSVVAPNTSCALSAPAMDSAYGAAMYYSANNPYVNQQFHSYIPESYGYAFSQTEYTQDNTGRISRQGGVGQEMQLNTQHETKYYYALTPDQSELDALFGTEAGDHTHYFKNAVRDANGQYSVSYVDMHGRTIATALAGSAPGGITALDSNIPSFITETLADASTNTTDGLSMVSHKSMLVEKSDSQHFVYSLNPLTLQLNRCKDTQHICYDCLYDLNITITDDCGNNKLGGQPLVITKSNLTVADAICNGTGIVLDTSIFLVEGNYEITKTLSVNAASENDYRNNVFIPNNICKDTADFISLQEQALPHGNCDLTCESCRASIGKYDDFANDYMTHVYGSTATISQHQAEIETAYNNALASCDAYCDDKVTSKTDYVEQAMLLDMSPQSGQYANIDSAADKYSIFYSDGTTQPEYQQASNYENEQGQPDSVFDNNIGLKVPPQQLDAVQFAEDFKPSWANALLPFHPEFCKLQEYQSHYDSYSWDKQFQAVSIYSDAITKGYDNPINGIDPDPINSTTIINLTDPYTEYTSVSNGDQTIGISMWHMAILQTKCPGSDSACMNNIIFNTNDYSLSCTADSNQAWQNFQALYSATKATQLANYYYNLPCVDKGDLINHFHTLNFNAFDGANGPFAFVGSASAQELADSGQSQTQAYYQSNCEAYDSLWTQELSPGYSQDQINDLLPLLTKVCVAGSDANHPFGSRDISFIGQSVDETIGIKDTAVRSFDDIINSYNNSQQVAKTMATTADVLSLPGPYASKQVYSQPLTTKPDASECSEINNYYSHYQNNQLPGETFSQYLKRTVNTDISEDDLNTLLNGCQITNVQCNNLDQPVMLPPIFQDSAQNPCTDCYLFNSLVDQYNSEYGDTASPKITDQTDTLQQRKNQLFANFMNNQLGYNLNVTDYVDFLNKCKGYTSGAAFSENKYKKSLSKQIVNNYNVDCSAPLYETVLPSYTNLLYLHKFDSVSTSYPYDIPANIVSASANNNNTWTNSQGSWSIVPGFTGNALQINSASPDTTTIVLSFHLEDTSYSERLVDVHFYNRSSDSGYTNWSMVVNGKYACEGNLFVDNSSEGGLLYPSSGYFQFYDPDGEGNEIIDTIKLFGGLHGASATFKMDEFGLSGYPIYNPNNNNISWDGGDDYQDAPYIGPLVDSLPENPPYPFYDTIYTTNDHELKNFNWTNSYNYWKGDNNSNNPQLIINSAVENTATITLNFNIDNGYALSMRAFRFAYTSVADDSAYKHWSICVNGIFVGQGDISSGDYGYQYPVFNPVQNITGQVNVVIKLSGGLHGVSSRFGFNGFFIWGNVTGSPIMPVNDSVPQLCGKSQPAYPITHLDIINSCTDSTFYAVSTGTEMYKNYLDSAKNTFDSLYHAKCLNAYNYETFTVTHTADEYHYTLYYYDQAGNLVQTVPPAAVRPNRNATYLSQVKTKRSLGDTLRPGHNLMLATEYRYNTLNQVISQKSPDGGTSKFYYDRLGRLTLSQNLKQSPLHKYSYTTYDPIGRTTEVGELTNAAAMNTTISKSPLQLQSWLSAASTSRTQITQTVYDIPYIGIDSIVLYAKNLRNRVAYMQYFNAVANQNNLKPQAGTYYSYDIEGNADTVVQDYTIPSLDTNQNRFFKKIVYQYDLISGKVNTIDYNPGQPDAFHHRYTYDAENRLTNVETSTDSIYWENEALYRYYYHGPLSRAVLGEQQVQGVDYAYTLQGWLKGVNTTNINTAFDMGNDGFTNRLSRINFARDAFGFALYYFQDDYKQISADNPTAFAPVDTFALNSFKPLYNGNIAAMGVNISSFSKPLLYNYGYDQLNRLIQLRTYNNSANKSGTTSFSTKTNYWSPASINDYSEDVAYDANGNILKYRRYANSSGTNLNNALIMDSLSYKYSPNTNELDWIKDSVPKNLFTVDIDNQGKHNYRYDSIGNLIKDSTNGIDSIIWNVYGKIQNVKKHDGTTITYSYDASGNRISKVVTGSSNGNGETWYVHDASGNVMSIYTVNDNTVNRGALTLSEQDIYGSSRLGLYKPVLNLISYLAPTPVTMNRLGNVGYYNNFLRGKKLFELSNHLGNVLVTITDKKIGIDNDNDDTVNYYNPDIVSANDYYPFGMQMPGRTYTANSSTYRYGFNGKEQDPEPYGQGNEYDYGFRIYNPRIGRFLSVDPLTQDYPFLTPYQYASNSPVSGIDRDGLEWAPPRDANGNVDNKACLEYVHAEGQEAIGLYESGKETVVGAYTAVRHPLNTVKGLGHAIAHPINTFTALKNNFLEEYNTNPARAAGKLGGDIFQLFFGAELFKGSTIAKDAEIIDREAIFSNNIATRGLAEKYALQTGYKGFKDANALIKTNNPVFDLFDAKGNVVDVTTTAAKKLNPSQFYKKLNNLGDLKGYNNRVLQIYVKDGQYTAEQINSLTQKLDSHIQLNNLQNTSFKITTIK